MKNSTIFRYCFVLILGITYYRVKDRLTNLFTGVHNNDR